MKRFLVVTMICLVLILSVDGNSTKSQALSRSKMVKMCKGKWDRSSQDGINSHYCVFTKNYLKWYRNGKYDHKVKIVKIQKRSSKEYAFKMQGKKTYAGKYQYIGTVKKGKFIGFDFYDGWSGKRGYSGGSSLYKLS